MTPQICSHRPPTTPTPQPEPQTKPKNESETPTEKNNTEEKKTAAPVRKLSRKVSRNRSFSMVTRSLADSPTSPVKRKVVIRKTATFSKNLQDKGSDEEIEENKKKAPTKKQLPKKAVEKKPVEQESEKEEKENKDQKETDQEEVKTGERVIKKKEEAPIKQSAVPKTTQKKMPHKSENEQTEEKDDDDDVQDEESSNKNNEWFTLEITEDENQPLIEYMIKVANYLYKQTNVKLLKTKHDSLRQKVAEVAKIIHEIEKVKTIYNQFKI